MTRAQYVRFRRDLLEAAKVYRNYMQTTCQIIGASALRSTRRQLVMLRDGYYRDGIY